MSSYDIPGAIIAPRGCGDSRTEGGVYAELGISPHGGIPIERFLVDPPNYAILQGGLTIPAAGVHLVEFGGVHHIFDHVGSEHYTVPDFIEEVARLGLSRRLQYTLDFSKLTRESRMFMLHSHAYIENADAYAPWTCPTDKEHQHGRGEHCIGCCWADADVGGTALVDAATGQVEREMPSFRYRTMLGRADVPLRRRPEGVKPVYKRAIFAKFPLGRIVVVGDPNDDEIARTAEKVRKAQLPTEIVGE